MLLSEVEGDEHKVVSSLQSHAVVDLIKVDGGKCSAEDRAMLCDLAHNAGFVSEDRLLILDALSPKAGEDRKRRGAQDFCNFVHFLFSHEWDACTNEDRTLSVLVSALCYRFNCVNACENTIKRMTSVVLCLARGDTTVSEADKASTFVKVRTAYRKGRRKAVAADKHRKLPYIEFLPADPMELKGVSPALYEKVCPDGKEVVPHPLEQEKLNVMDASLNCRGNEQTLMESQQAMAVRKDEQKEVDHGMLMRSVLMMQNMFMNRSDELNIQYADADQGKKPKRCLQALLGGGLADLDGRNVRRKRTLTLGDDSQEHPEASVEEAPPQASGAKKPLDDAPLPASSSSASSSREPPQLPPPSEAPVAADGCVDAGDNQETPALVSDPATRASKMFDAFLDREKEKADAKKAADLEERRAKAEAKKAEAMKEKEHQLLVAKAAKMDELSSKVAEKIPITAADVVLPISAADVKSQASQSRAKPTWSACPAWSACPDISIPAGAASLAMRFLCQWLPRG